MTDLLCPNCELGALQLITYDEVIQYRNEEILVSGLAAYQCARCGEHSISPEQAQANHAVFAAKKAEVANRLRTQCGMLDGNAIRDLRNRLGLTQVQFARAIDCPPTAISKYERGEVMQSAGLDTLFRIIRDVPAAAAYICEKAGRATGQAWTVASSVSLEGALHMPGLPNVVEVLEAANQAFEFEAYSSADWASAPARRGVQ